VLFSDGVTEADNADGEEFGDDRLEACVNALRSATAADVRDAVQRHVKTFCGTTVVRDDVTVMVVKAH